VAGWRQLESVWMTLAVEFRVQVNKFVSYKLQVRLQSSGYGLQELQVQTVTSYKFQGCERKGGEYFSVCVIVCERLGRLS